MAKPGTIQVNTTDYASGVVVEQFDGYEWMVPAWDEMGFPYSLLSGPFEHEADAYAMLDDFHAYA